MNFSPENLPPNSNLYLKIAFRRRLTIPALILLLCIFSYSNTFHNDFLLDDYPSFIEKNNLSSTPVSDLFSRAYKGQYRPLCLLLLKLEVSLFGLNRFGYHFINLALFYGICLLFLIILRKLTRNEELATLATCLYAVHPLHNVFLNYKAAGPISLYILFMQLSTICLIKHLDSKKGAFYWASLPFYFFSLLSHEVGFMLPIYIFLIVFFYGSEFKKSAYLSLSYLTIFILYLSLRFKIMGIHTFFMMSDFTAHNYVANLLGLIGWYIGKLLLPINYIFVWDQKITYHYDLLKNITSLLILGFLVVLCFRRKLNVLTFSLMLFISGFIPLISASFVYTPYTNTAAIEPHWFGFTSIGFFLLISCLFLKLKGVINQRAWFTLIAVIIAGLSLLTRYNNTFWKDKETYCSYWVKLNLFNGTPWGCCAEAFIEKNDKGLNKNLYKNCTEVTDLAGAYNITSNEVLAYQYYQMALEINRSCLPAIYGLRALDFDTSPDKEIYLKFLQTSRINPNFYNSYKKRMEYIKEN